VSEASRWKGRDSLYGMTKLASELMVEEYSDAYGFRFLIDRCGLITGPRQMAKADRASWRSGWLRTISAAQSNTSGSAERVSR